MGFFSFKKTYDNIGVGTRDLGLLQRTTLPAGGSYLGPQWNIKRSFRTTQPRPITLINGAAVVGDPMGSGVYIPGQYALSQLVQNSNK